MNGKKAKQLRKQVYGDISLGHKKYFRNPKTRQITRDPLRRQYQQMKKK